ncbi:hypothetical protein HJC23_003090 [Cyclotella cryptica]|uniref:Calmodulin-lysine N-methyltransferase n=1 Tax=Cyclotella cryptica TaxID=29204 RepID=A0ABD3P3B4_9STRA
MQNRLVITGIPSSVPHLPNAAAALRDLIEDHVCWVDRFAFLSPRKTKTHIDIHAVAAAAELHIENVRDCAVRHLNGLTVVLDENGCLYSTSKGDGNVMSFTSRGSDDCKGRTSFTIGACAASPMQSKQLIQQCPIQHDYDDAKDKSMEKQVLHLPLDGIELIVKSSIKNGVGTGSTPWRGGWLFSQQICHWFCEQDSSDGVNFDSLFLGKKVLELGAGSTGLPSMTLAKISVLFHYAMNVTCSDGVDETVDALRINIAENGLRDSINVEHINWNDYCKNVGVGSKPLTYAKADTTLFADCIYNDNGVDVFEKSMKEEGFSSKTMTITVDLSERTYDFLRTGGGGKNYRLVCFRMPHAFYKKEMFAT